MCGLHRSKFVIREECDACVVRNGTASALEMTMNVYAHVTLDGKREALDQLNELFREDSS